MRTQLVPLADHRRYPEEEMPRRAVSFHEELKRRRTVRDYSPEPVPRDVIETCLLAAGTAPNGANRQPWHFVVVTTLTHTPSPMGFLNGLLGRPENERPYLILVVGHPAPDARVPAITKKALSGIASFIE